MSNDPYPERVYTGWSSVHWNATGWLSVHWDTTGWHQWILAGYTGTPLVNVDEMVPHWNTTRETLTIARGTNGGRNYSLRPQVVPRDLSRGADKATSLSGRFRWRSTCFATVFVNTGVNFLNGLRTCAEGVDGSSFYINEAIRDY